MEMNKIEKDIRYAMNKYNTGSRSLAENEFRASKIGDCHNALTLDSEYEEVENNTDNLRTAFGHIWGMIMNKILTDAGYIIVAQEELIKIRIGAVGGREIRITGHSDFLIKEKESQDDTVILLEIKTLNDYSFDKIRMEIPRIYLWQVMSYLHYYRKKYGEEKIRAFLCLISLSGDIHLKEVQYDKKVWAKIKEHLRSVYEHRIKGSEGIREYVKGQPPCSWCRHARVCWSIPDDETLTGETILSKNSTTDTIWKEVETIQRLRNDKDQAEATTKRIDSKIREASLALLRLTGSRKVCVPGSFRLAIDRGRRITIRDG